MVQDHLSLIVYVLVISVVGNAKIRDNGVSVRQEPKANTNAP